MEGGVLLKICLQDERCKNVATQYYMFTSKEKCETFICDMFVKRLFEWARTHSDEWHEIKHKFGFKGKTDDKCLEILKDYDTLVCLWQHYNSQLLAEGKDVWLWHLVNAVSLDPKQGPTEIGPYNIDSDFY